MKQNEKGAKEKLEKTSKLLYIAAAIVAISGIAMLITNILIFKTSVEQYVAQGYPADMVIQSLIPSQLLPGIFQPIGLYGGVVFLILGIIAINNKISKHLTSVIMVEGMEDINSKEDTEYDTEYVDPTDIEENIDEQEFIGVEEYTEEEKTAEDTKEEEVAEDTKEEEVAEDTKEEEVAEDTKEEK